MPDSLHKHVSDRLNQLCQDARGPIAIAVSGGSDSLALLYLTATWARQFKRPCLALTVDHGIRPEAREEAEIVAAHAQRLGIRHRVLNWHPPKGKISQATARRARHARLSTALREAGGTHLLTGHTRDDQAETFLIRIHAKSGWYGLAGIQSCSVSPVWPEGRDTFIARPLLDIGRSELRAELIETAVEWCEDPSNHNTDFERVRARARLTSTPSLGAKIKTIQADLSRLRHIEDDKIHYWLDVHAQARPDGTISVGDTSGLNPENLARALAPLLMFASGQDRPARWMPRLRLATAILSGDFNGATLGGAHLVKRRGEILIGRDPGEIAPLNQTSNGIWDGRFALGSPRATSQPTGIIHPLARPGLDDSCLLNRQAYCLISERMETFLKANRLNRLNRLHF